MVLFYVPVGPLSFRRARSLDAKDRSSFRLQSITCASRHVSAKNATRSVRIHQDLSSTPENSKVVYIGVSLEFSPVLRGQIQQPQSPQRALRQNDAKPGKREKSCLLVAGGTGNVQEKTFLINCQGMDGRTGAEVGQAHIHRKSQSQMIEILSVQGFITL